MTSVFAAFIVAAAWATSQEPPPPSLSCYSQPAHNGTIARREFKNADGHVVKEIFYFGPLGADGRPSCDERTLRVRLMKTYEHDLAGRPIVERLFDPDERLSSLMRLDYGADGQSLARARSSDPAGMLRTETRWQDGQFATMLEYDEQGRVALVQGLLPADVKYSIAWGPSLDGWACGVSALTRSGPPEAVVPAVHLRNLSSTEGMARFSPRFDAELIDPRGRLIPQHGAGVQRVAAPQSRMLGPREAAYVGGPDLRSRFGRLSPGRYTLIAWHPHPRSGTLLECGALQVQIK